MTTLTVGDKAKVRKIFTADEVAAFAKISGDANPIHLDEAYAAGTVFGKCIVHGMLVASLFSRLLGMELPGEGTIYLGQSLRFTAPVYVGEEVTATVEVIKTRGDKPIVTFRTFCENGKGETVIDGEAVVKLP